MDNKIKTQDVWIKTEKVFVRSKVSILDTPDGKITVEKKLDMVVITRQDFEKQIENAIAYGRTMGRLVKLDTTKNRIKYIQSLYQPPELPSIEYQEMITRKSK